MKLKVNNIPVENVTYNGVELNELQYNGVVVWRREQPQPTEKEYMYVDITNAYMPEPIAIEFSNYEKFNNLEYSIDSIDDWMPVENGKITAENIWKARVYLRADGFEHSYPYCGIKVYWESDKTPELGWLYFELGGDARSLLSRENFESTPLTDYCFANLFDGCENLLSVGDNFLRSTTLAIGCYSYMFNGCTLLQNIPDNLLPATTLVTNCYDGMFYGCTRLTTAPILPATTLVDGCYGYMFHDCSSLTSVTTYAINWNKSCSSYWLRNVADRGTAHCPNGASGIPEGGVAGWSGVPEGWTLDTTPIN